MIAASHTQHCHDGPTVLGTLVRVWLSVVLGLQLLGFASMGSVVATGKTADLAALSRAVGYTVSLCRHGDDGSSHHDRSGHGDCCQLGLCQDAHRDFALVPTIVAPVPPAKGGYHRDRSTTATIPTGPPLAGAVSPRGPPSFV